MKWLTGDGAVAALGAGGAVAAGLGWRGVLLLLAFFVSSSLLTQASGGEWGGGGRSGARGRGRDARQVLANGGVAAVAALCDAWVVAAGALAAATADTWATEIGAFSPRRPRLITTGTTVARGTSGGITLLGTTGGAVGACALGALAAVLEPRTPASLPAGVTLGAVVAGAGVTGMLVDSVLGAVAQGQWECPACSARFERHGAFCHEPVARIKGYGWLDNDGVNLAATLAGGLLAAAGVRALR